MKSTNLLILVSTLIALPACEQKPSTTEKVKDAVNDGLDRRPAEKLQDAAEDAKDGIKDAAGDTKDALKDAAKEIEGAVKEATK
jgi:uncharacterized protein YjbJ (UPF0337 family)